MAKFVFNQWDWERAAGHIFLLCLLGSLFVQPKPALIIMALAVLMLLTLPLTAAGRTSFKRLFIKESYLITWAFLLWFAAHLLIVLVHPPWVWRNLENYTRVFAAMGVLAFLIKTKPSANWLYAGIAVACVGALAHALLDRFVHHNHRAIGWFNNEIHFGSYSALAGLLAILIGVLALDLKRLWRVGLVVLGVMGFAAAAISGTRSALLIAVCLLPTLMMDCKDRLQHYLRLVLLCGVVVAALLIALSPSIQKQIRLTSAISDIKGIQEGKAQTSIADRLQMWQAALNMAQSSPWVGVGLNNFQTQLQHQVDTAQIKPLAEMRNQAHSQILHSLATGGLVLLLAYALFVALPFLWFGRYYRTYRGDATMQLLSYLGMANIAAHVVFGLVNAIFDIQIFSSVYVLLLVALAALCLNRKTQIETGKPPAQSVQTT